jgi:putative flippase GtrA
VLGRGLSKEPPAAPWLGGAHLTRRPRRPPGSDRRAPHVTTRGRSVVELAALGQVRGSARRVTRSKAAATKSRDMTSLSVPGPLAAHGVTVRQLASFGAIGVASTAAYVALYAWLREAMPAGAANAVALVATAVGNTAANRWLTFGIRGRDGLARDHAAGILALGAALAITSAGLVLLNAVAPNHGRLTEVSVLVAANAAATLVRFLLLRFALGRPSAAGPHEPSLVTPSTSKKSVTGPGAGAGPRAGRNRTELHQP